MKQFLAETQCFLFSQQIVLNKRLLCSFSGGQDSSVVFFSLLHRKTTSQHLNIIYCHHFWQVQNFQASVSIFQLSFVLKIPYTLILPNKPIVNENRSRDWRKKALSRFSHIEYPSILITGHTQTDTLETNLNNLVRGTSLKGFRKVNYQKYKTPVILFFSPFIFVVSSLSPFCLTPSKQMPDLEKNGQKLKVFFTSPYKFSQKFSNFTPPQPSLWESVDKPFFTKKNTLNQQKSRQLAFGKFHGWKNVEVETLKNNYKIEFYLARLPEGFFTNGNNFRHRLRNQNKNSASFCFYSRPSELKLYLEKPIEKKTRQTILKLAKIYDLPVFQDITNFSFHSSRNKIRHILFPLLGSISQKKVNVSLSHFFEILKQENDQFKKLFRKFYFLFNFFPFPFKDNEGENFEKLLWVFFYDTREFKFQPQFFKKSVENFSERDLAFEHIFSLQKILLIKSQLEK